MVKVKAAGVIFLTVLSLVVLGLPMLLLGSVTNALGGVQKRILTWGTHKLTQYNKELESARVVERELQKLNSDQ